MKQKLYWLFPHLEQDTGGTKFLFEVAKRLVGTYDITILCNTGSVEIIKRFQRQHINVRTTSYISANSNIYWLFLPFFLPYDFLIYAAHLRKADIIVSTMYPANFLAYVYTKFSGKKHFHYCYEPFPYLHNNDFIAKQKGTKRAMMTIFARLYSWTDTLAVKNATRVFTLNTATQRMIKRVYKKSAIITYMGVDTNHFRKYIRNPIRKQFSGKLLLVHSTDYSIAKHTELAIQAVREVVKKFPNVLLVITTTSPGAPEKMQYVQLVTKYNLTHNVKFVDYVSYSDLPKYYAAARCYLSCSYDKMLGTTTSNLPVKEALACQTPAIRAAATREDVVDGVSGFLVDPKDTKEVAKKLTTLLRDPKKAAEMGKRGRIRMLKEYSWDKVSDILKKELR